MVNVEMRQQQIRSFNSKRGKGDGKVKVTSKTAAVIAYTSTPRAIAGWGRVQSDIVVAAGSVVIACAWFAWVPIGSGTIIPWLVIVEGKAPLTLGGGGGGGEGGKKVIM